jgi:hypothetical protein
MYAVVNHMKLGRPLDNNILRVLDGDQLVTEVARTTTKSIARFKVRKPEPPRQVVQLAGAC